MDLYFQRHDGQAVTCDDFVAGDGRTRSGVDLAQFRRWYDQAGTPRARRDRRLRRGGEALHADGEAVVPPTPGQPEKQPFHIPLAVGLIGSDGTEIPLQLEGEPTPRGTDRVLSLKQAEERFVFDDVPAKPVPSLAARLLRAGDPELRVHRGRADAPAWRTTPTRSTAGKRASGSRPAFCCAGSKRTAPAKPLACRARSWTRSRACSATAAAIRRSPPRRWRCRRRAYLAEQMDVVDPDAIHAVRVAPAARARARAAATSSCQTYRVAGDLGTLQPGRTRPPASGALRNLALGYLMELESTDAYALCAQQFDRADNMTDCDGGARRARQLDGAERATRRSSASTRDWKDEPLVRRQVARGAGDLAAARHARARRAADAPRGVRHPEPEQGLRADPRVLLATTCASTRRTAAGYAFAADR